MDGYCEFAPLRKDSDGIPLVIRPDTSCIEFTAGSRDGGVYAFDWNADGMIDREGGYISFTYSDKLKLPSNWSDEKVVRVFADMYDVTYAFCLQRSIERGAATYVMGMNSGESEYDNKGRCRYSEEEMEERYAISRWGLMDPVERLNLVRDVYPLSLLSPAHLAIRVGEQTLEQWIRQDPSRGTLEPFTPSISPLMAWRVPEARIASLRQELRALGLFKWAERPSPSPDDEQLSSEEVLERLYRWAEGDDDPEDEQAAG